MQSWCLTMDPLVRYGYCTPLPTEIGLWAAPIYADRTLRLIHLFLIFINVAMFVQWLTKRCTYPSLSIVYDVLAKAWSTCVTSALPSKEEVRLKTRVVEIFGEICAASVTWFFLCINLFWCTLFCDQSSILAERDEQ